MKTKYFLQGLVSALVLLSGLVSCNSETIPDKDADDSQDFVEVSLRCSGEISVLEQTPLSRAEGTDLYYVQVITVKIGEDDKEYYESYAHGLFTDPSLMKVRLKKTDRYEIYATMVKDGISVIASEKNYYRLPFNCMLENSFVYGNVFEISNVFEGTADIPTDEEGYFERYDTPSIERYFGYLEDYFPAQDGNASIDMAKMNFGLNVVTENFTEGRLEIEIYGGPGIVIEYPQTEAFRAYSLYDLYNSYLGDYQNDFGAYEWKKVTVFWTDNEGIRRIVAEKRVTFYRNKKTTIKVRIDESVGFNPENVNISVDQTEMTVDPVDVIF